MDEKAVNEIKAQLWSCLQHIRGRIDELVKAGVFIRPSEWWVDRGGVERNSRWLIDQLLFCQGEIEEWKTWLKSG